MKKYIEIFRKDIKLIKGDDISDPKITFGLEYPEYVGEKVREIIRGNPSQIIIKNSSNEKIETRDVLPSDSYQLAFRSLWTDLKEIIIKNHYCQIISKNKSDQIIETRNLTSDYFDYKKEKLKGIEFKVNFDKNPKIEDFSLTVVIKYTLETEEVFNYIKFYPALYLYKMRKKNKTEELNLKSIVDFAEGNERRILKTHAPKNVTIECYINVESSVDDNTIGSLTEIINANSYPDDSRIFGVFTSTSLKEEEKKRGIQGFGDKIASEDITDLWNED